MRLTLAAALTLVLPLAPSGAAADDTVTTFTLANGLEAVVIEDHRAPVVTQMVWYNVGAADDPPGQSGIAHYLEHLMFKGTENLGEGEFSRIVRGNGGEDNAFTSYDYTGYFQRIAADRLDLVMSMEADRMANLGFPGSAARSELDVVIEERRQVVENRPGTVFNEQRRAVQYLNHPYGRPVIGWMHEIEALTPDHAMAFYAAHYAPNNAMLIVAGAVTPDEVEALAETHYGPIPANDAIAVRARTAEPAHIAARRVEYRDARVQNPYVIRTYLAEPRRSGAQGEAAALRVLAELLGGGITSALARDMQVDDDFALDAGAFYADTALDLTSFGVYVTPNPGIGLADAEARMDAVIARFMAEGPDAAQLERIKTRLLADEVYARDNLQRRAREFGGALTAGLAVEDVLAWPDALQAVTEADVMTAAEAVFRPEASVTGWLLGTEDAPAGTGTAGPDPVLDDTEILGQ
ncbi:pitrilysin family protein [soil metagenome]